MPKTIKFKNDTYLNTSGIMNNHTRLDNIFAGIMAYGGDDINITNQIAWGIYKYNYFNLSQNSNTNVFELSNGGVKIKQSGWYMMYSTINIDTNDGYGSGFILVNDNPMVIKDIHQQGGMNNYDSPVEILYLNADTMIYAGFRLQETGTHLSRMSRSCLSILRIS